MTDTDKDLWMIVRQALLMIVTAIEKKYNLESKRVVYVPLKEDSTDTYTIPSK